MSDNRAPQFPLHFGGGGHGAEIQGEKKMTLLNALSSASLTNKKARDILKRYGFTALGNQFPNNDAVPRFPDINGVRQQIRQMPPADVDARYEDGADYREAHSGLPANHDAYISEARDRAGGGGGGGGGAGGGQPSQ